MQVEGFNGLLYIQCPLDGTECQPENERKMQLIFQKGSKLFPMNVCETLNSLATIN